MGKLKVQPVVFENDHHVDIFTDNDGRLSLVIASFWEDLITRKPTDGAFMLMVKGRHGS